MAKNLTEGDRVQITSLPTEVKNGQDDGLDKYNPRGVHGVVVKVGGGNVKGLPIRVQWPNGYFNRYAGNNLEKVEL
jgi:murein DD-endopeptidase MepM/ murein hydrolase activator NlpD